MGNLAYDDSGQGEIVLFIAGQGGAGRTWQIHQAPALLAAGYRVVTFDNRGVGATDKEDGFTTATMVADTVELIEKLDAGPARVVGASMGSFIAQELMLARPELVSHAVLMATRGHHDRARTFFRTAEEDFANAGVQLPATYEAKLRLLESFSPKTLNDDAAVADWIDTFTLWPTRSTPGLRAQHDVAPATNRLPAYRAITQPVLVIGFADDLVIPPHLGAAVADAIPNGHYLEIADTGHLGFLERPDAVNAAVLEFFTQGR
ncbi:putative hydrolase or acyltransferase of alpha/beta superfamily [Mycolicibacterium rhodesiae NBB3]|uniref:Putative hydrolase or acyltransferase of alpha/beta superfamily n=1 Tax=Mycolicibacterium rhodesiae (strain NBB3) TaxID=710685 RepID=G8RIX9_MYCRN|nr:alpha/beta hydrolase [Mycolicibacterium rhodesiae]AEV70967.1 putative hydrolase or acyltransferase of alpha/beta superfamily [Mycolicibacterium rhodesiae NBB3]